jgi:hypothetical protein
MKQRNCEWSICYACQFFEIATIHLQSKILSWLKVVSQHIISEIWHLDSPPQKKKPCQENSQQGCIVKSGDWIILF